jgi:hypothetical protein
MAWPRVLFALPTGALGVHLADFDPLSLVAKGLRLRAASNPGELQLRREFYPNPGFGRHTHR